MARTRRWGETTPKKRDTKISKPGKKPGKLLDKKYKPYRKRAPIHIPYGSILTAALLFGMIAVAAIVVPSILEDLNKLMEQSANNNSQPIIDDGWYTVRIREKDCNGPIILVRNSLTRSYLINQGLASEDSNGNVIPNARNEVAWNSFIRKNGVEISGQYCVEIFKED